MLFYKIIEELVLAIPTSKFLVFQKPGRFDRPKSTNNAIENYTRNNRCVNILHGCTDQPFTQEFFLSFQRQWTGTTLTTLLSAWPEQSQGNKERLISCCANPIFHFQDAMSNKSYMIYTTDLTYNLIKKIKPMARVGMITRRDKIFFHIPSKPW